MVDELKVLIVVDMQNDFIDGALGSKEAKEIVPNVCKKIQEYQKEDCEVIFTDDYIRFGIRGENVNKIEALNIKNRFKLLPMLAYVPDIPVIANRDLKYEKHCV